MASCLKCGKGTQIYLLEMPLCLQCCMELGKQKAAAKRAKAA